VLAVGHFDACVDGIWLAELTRSLASEVLSRSEYTFMVRSMTA
jgi:hypothetical protein